MLLVDSFCPVLGQNDRRHPQTATGYVSQCSDRGETPAMKQRQQSTFGCHGRSRHHVVKLGERLERFSVVAADFDSQGTLAGSR